jgi:hypothetical protein
MPYIIEGPAKIGNVFGYYGVQVPQGKFAIVSNGEYYNGGHGPSQYGPSRLFDTREEAEKVLQELMDELPKSDVE